MKTACLGKVWFSSYSQKWFLANEISVSFNRQYFTNRLISDFDFWHVDKPEWKKQGSLTGFVKKKFFWGGNGQYWAQKLRILIALDPLEEYFQHFAQWKGLIGRWEWFLWFSQKIVCLGPKMVHPYHSVSAVRIFLKFAQWKGLIGRWK